MSAIGIIPARYGAMRLPGKPLVDLLGKTMIQRVWEGAREATLLERLLIATDDERIANVCSSFGAEAVLTAPELPSGTDRIASAYQITGKQYDIVVNIQGDEPLLRGAVIDDLLRGLAATPNASVATPIKRLTNAEDLSNPAVVKVARDKTGRALYFSRSAIPFVRDAESQAEWLTYQQLNNQQLDNQQSTTQLFWKHIGIYAYRTPTLLRFQELKPSALEQAEQLEQLRLLEDGAEFLCVETEVEFVAIDTPTDVERVREILRTRTIQ